MRKTTTIENCKVYLEPGQVTGLSNTLALRLIEMSGKEAQKKEWMARYREETKAIKDEIRLLSRTIIDGYEIQEVECELRYDFEEGIVSTIRTDTGECINTRELTPDERQEEIE